MLPVLLQAVGLVAALVGVFLLFPLGLALLASGVAVGGLGVLIEWRTASPVPDVRADGERYTS